MIPIGRLQGGLFEPYLRQRLPSSYEEGYSEASSVDGFEVTAKSRRMCNTAKRANPMTEPAATVENAPPRNDSQA